ncbi:MAG: 4-hydroxy-3-methylbut-2-enyl diphosphate reductase [Patescibacteria group bacterium]
MKNIILAKKYGFCFGVKRAINALEKNKGRAFTLGPIIHNPAVVSAFKRKGICPISDFAKTKKGDKIFIRAHGVAENIINKGRKRGLKIIDLTCPYVKKSQLLALSLEKSGLKVIIIGQKNHPEIVAIAANLKAPIIISNEKDLSKIKKSDKLGIICQTTSNVKVTAEIINILKKRGSSIKIYDTVCQATRERQAAAKILAIKSDLVIVVGGNESSNTKKLKEVCSQYAKTYQIEDEKGLRKNWFKNKKTIGLTAGASTPNWLIEKVYSKIQRI